jgi:hypothetical protein
MKPIETKILNTICEVFNKNTEDNNLEVICEFNEIKTVDKIDLICYRDFKNELTTLLDYYNDDSRFTLPTLFNFSLSYSRDGKKWYKLYNNYDTDLNKCTFLFGEEDVEIPG